MTKKKIATKKPATKKKSSSKAFKQKFIIPIIPNDLVKQCVEPSKPNIEDFVKNYNNIYYKIVRSNKAKFAKIELQKLCDKSSDNLNCFFPKQCSETKKDTIITPGILNRWLEEENKKSWPKEENISNENWKEINLISDGEQFRKALDDINSIAPSEKEIAKLIIGSDTDRNEFKEKLLNTYQQYKIKNSPESVSVKDKVVSSSRPMKEIVEKNKIRLNEIKNALQSPIEEIKNALNELQSPIKEETNDNKIADVAHQHINANYLIPGKHIAPKISQKEYLEKYKSLEHDVIQELENILTHRDNKLDKAQKAIDQFEKQLAEKTVAYYKIRREFFTLTKVYDAAMEEVFGKK